MTLRAAAAAWTRRNAEVVPSSLPADTKSLSWLPLEWTTSIGWPLGVQLPVLRPFGV